jgi:predicted alpha/beta-hydrolase family hydrolase
MKKTDLLLNGSARAKTIIILAHGAGAAMDTPFMEFFAEGLADHGFRVARFEFPYMAARRTTGKKAGPDREPKLRATWHEAIGLFEGKQIVIGGKSMGGRIASLVADEAEVSGLICLGYPFHPVGKPDRLRTEHLAEITTPTLIVQGTRDPFGTPDEVAGYPLGKQVQVHWLEDGDHSFKPRKKSGRTEEQNWREGVGVIANFISQSTNVQA